MKLATLIIAIALVSLSVAHGQTKVASCDCPKNDEGITGVDTTFHLSNGKTLVLCGYRNEDTESITFSEFVIAVCGEDTVIDFWDATQYCTVKVEADTLLIEDLHRFPTGKDFQYEDNVWSTEKIFFVGNKTVLTNQVNRQIPKYSSDEIQAVLKNYETATPPLSDSKMELANQLFIAAISGSKKAREYFHDFRTRFGELDGAFSEEYSDLSAMLSLWDKNK